VNGDDDDSSDDDDVSDGDEDRRHAAAVAAADADMLDSEYDSHDDTFLDGVVAAIDGVLCVKEFLQIF
jgi:hypothetical protein